MPSVVSTAAVSSLLVVVSDSAPPSLEFDGAIDDRNSVVLEAVDRASVVLLVTTPTFWVVDCFCVLVVVLVAVLVVRVDVDVNVVLDATK